MAGAMGHMNIAMLLKQAGAKVSSSNMNWVSTPPAYVPPEQCIHSTLAIRMPQGEVESTPELENQFRVFVKTGSQDEVLAAIKWGVVNVSAVDPSVRTR